jgi:hypothetical protein
MARLRAKKRRKLKKGQFGLPGKRKYPMHDKAHASNAKARATQQYKKGRISKSTRDKIHAKANKKLGKSKKRKKRRTRRK